MSHDITEKMNRVIPVILCGGSGERLWPISRRLYPKPFIKMSDGKTLFEKALERIKPFSEKPIIVCNYEHRFYVMDALSRLGMEGDIILESARRNTAPAIALAAIRASSRSPDSLILVMPSDHVFDNEDVFMRAVGNALSLADQNKIMVFGICPSSPSTSYGYIEKGIKSGDSCYLVSSFVEKPHTQKAAAMLASGNYLWNSGIFLMRSDFYISELREFEPKIYECALKAMAGCARDGGFIRPEKSIFEDSPNISIDYAIMEKTAEAALVPLDCGWEDMGVWESFYGSGVKDENGNVHQGDVLSLNSSNNYIYSQNRLVAVYGLQNLAIIESADAVLVIPRHMTEKVKLIVGSLKEQGRKETELHPLVYRPWGNYECLASGDRFQVKKITVLPGASLSLQLHHHRSEHWVVVKGTAEVTINDNVVIYTENQSVYIPLGSRHKLKNPGVFPLEIIEIQSGPYLGEDDIIRFEDIYGRN